MIIIEDDFSIDNDFDCVFPINYTLYNGKELEIYTYERFLTIAEKFQTLFSDDPFTNEALEWIHENFKQPALDNGYTPDEKSINRWIYTYKIDDISQINKSIILPSTIKLEPSCDFENLTTFKLDDKFDEELISYATVIDNKIVSISSENSSFSDDVAEIGVETAPDYRRMGYASSNIAAIAEYLMKTNKMVTYNCNCFNVASQKSAARAGFINDGKAYYYICYKT